MSCGSFSANVGLRPSPWIRSPLPHPVKTTPFLPTLLVLASACLGNVEISGIAKAGNSILVFCSVEGTAYSLSAAGQSAGDYSLVDLDLEHDCATFWKDGKLHLFKLREGSVTDIKTHPATPPAVHPLRSDRVIITREIRENPRRMKALANFVQGIDQNAALSPEEREALKKLLTNPDAKIVVMGPQGLSSADSTAALPLDPKSMEQANRMQKLGEKTL